jgi:hypothetical protein
LIFFFIISAHLLLWQYEEGLLEESFIQKFLQEILESSSDEQACLMLSLIRILIGSHSMSYQTLLGIHERSAFRLKKVGFSGPGLAQI